MAKKLAFLENQLVARDMTNLTPIQLEEFESVFRHFDRGGSNSLSELEFSAALASLGLVYDEAEMHARFQETCTSSGRPSDSGVPVSEGMGRVSFEGFIRFMVSVTEDQNTAEQVFQSFREVADGKEWVTELDLRHSLIPEEMVEELVKCMPVREDGEGEDEEGKRFDYVEFMERVTEGKGVLNGVH